MEKIETRKRTKTTMKLKVIVTQSDVLEGRCGLANKCMEQVAVVRALMVRHKIYDPIEVRKLNVRVDGASIKYNLGGWRWEAKTPLVAKRALIDFDDKNFHLIQPHEYVLIAERTTKIYPMTPERQAQVNEARRVRVAEGREPKTVKQRTLHQRVIGMAKS